MAGTNVFTTKVAVSFKLHHWFTYYGMVSSCIIGLHTMGWFNVDNQRIIGQRLFKADRMSLSRVDQGLQFLAKTVFLLIATSLDSCILLMAR